MRLHRARLIALTATATVLIASGCASTPANRDGASGHKSNPSAPATFGEGEGAVEGRVVDDEFHPLAGVRLFLLEVRRETLTDAGGVFRFDDVPQGAHTVLAQLEGFEPAASSVEVRDAEVSERGIVLVRLAPTNVARMVMLPAWQGYVSCGVSTGPTTSLDYCGGAFGLPRLDENSDWLTVVTFEKGMTAWHWELAWDQSHVLSARMLNVFATNVVLRTCEGFGASPVVRTCAYTNDPTDGASYNKHYDATSSSSQVQIGAHGNVAAPSTFEPEFVTMQHFTLHQAFLYYGLEPPPNLRLRPDE